MSQNNSLKALTKLPTTVVCDAIETFNVRLRNEGHISGDIINRVSGSEAMVGYAITIKMRSDTTPVNGLSYNECDDWWDIFSTISGPKIIVIEDVGQINSGSMLGKVHGAIFKSLGAIGIITNGAVRDVEKFSDMKFPLYSSSVCASHSYSHIVEIGAPVVIGGLEIKNGDLLHGDKNGVVQIPNTIIDDIPKVANKILEHQNNIINFCNSSQSSVEELRKIVNSFNQHSAHDGKKS